MIWRQKVDYNGSKASYGEVSLSSAPLYNVDTLLKINLKPVKSLFIALPALTLPNQYRSKGLE